MTFAQKPEHVIRFNSGKFTPPENINRLSKDSSVFKKSLFKNRHYLAIQFQQTPDEKQLQKLRVAGIEVMDYLSGNTYTVAIPEKINMGLLRSFAARSIFQLGKEHKASPEILNETIPAHAIKEPGFVDVNMITYQLFNREDLIEAFSIWGIAILEEQPMFRTMILRVPSQQISKLIESPFVQWVEPIDPPNQAENLLGRSFHGVNILSDGVRNLKGSGIKIGVWDGGEVDKHLDFSAPNRLVFLERGSTSSHGTHVAGTIGGAGLINPKAKGMAPNATIFSSDFSVGTTTTEIFNAITQHGLAISSHSYGGSVASCLITGSQIAYTATSRNTDITLNNFPTHLHIHSAGNSQTSCAGGFYTITGSGKTAKNNIVVANITSIDDMSSSSSFGPVHDGRIKPEISAMGTNVLSTYTPNNTYATISGTSMATPGVSGTVALLVERFLQLNGKEPVSSLVKGIVCNTATDLGNPGPDYKFGFGKINALAAVKTIEDNRYVVQEIAHGESKDLVIEVPAGAVRLKAMLTWNDPAAAANSAAALVNNLDLTVSGNGNTILPWILNPASPNNNATKAVDTYSNIEQVTIDNPAAGSYTLKVSGTSIPIGSTQQYSLTWVIDYPFIEITYPNGKESFDPGDAETISWITAGITGTQTIQYSADNGNNWINLATGVPASTTRFVWTVPDLNTSKVLIRVSGNGLTDVSDAPFNILGTPKNISHKKAACNTGVVNLKWDAVKDATHYDLMKLNEVNGMWETIKNDITTNETTVSGLAGGTNYWFSLTAKNIITGASSERAIALSVIAPMGNLQTPGAITGNQQNCSNSKGLVYTVAAVPNATSYIWQVPAGATIVNGQGTQKIQVDFESNATNGVITVYATDGTCQTEKSNLSVTIIPGPSLNASPYNSTICAPASIQLTAAAPGSTGTVYNWSPAEGLNTTTGPLVTASPSQTTTYFVTATNPDGCNAISSTTVFVGNGTGAVTSNSPVCEGGTLNLTASPAVSNKYASVKITEVVQFRDGSGSTPVYPFYVPAISSAEDMLEISNVDNANPVDVSGVVFELWTGTTLNRSLTVPNGVVLPPNQVMVIYLGSAGTDNPGYRFFRTGGTNNPVLSSAPVGWLLRSPLTGIIDVVATNSYIWPAASGVTTAHWSGNISSSTNIAGVIRTAAVDNNTAANWQVASTSLLQSIGTYNNGYTNVSPYTWTGPGGFVSTEQNPVRPNATGAMAGNYLLTYTGGNNGCVTSQTTSVTINPGVAPAISAGANFPVCIGNNLLLNATSTDPASTFRWTGPNGFTSTLQNPAINNIGFVNAGMYTVTISSGSCTQTASVNIPLKSLAGTYKIAPGADYNSLTEAISDYNNASCIQGPVVFELLNTYNPAFETLPVTINNSPGASAVNTLTIRPAVGANPQILGSINGAAIIRFNGARYVTIDGRQAGSGNSGSLIIENLSTSALAGTSAVTFINGAQYNRIDYVKLLNGTTNGSQTAGNIIFGSATVTGNSYNTISNSFFAGSQESQTQMRYGLICDGSNTTRNSNNTIDGNEFYSAVFRGMPLNAGLGNNWNILNNHFYWHGGTFSTAGPRTILMNNTGSSGHTIRGNFIGGSQPFAMGSWQFSTTGATTWNGIDLTLGTNEVTNITNNTIRNVNITSAAANYGVMGMALFAGNYNVENNTITDISFTSTGVNSILAGIYYQNAVPGKQTKILSNTITNLTNGSLTANPATVLGFIGFTAANEKLLLNKNRIANLSIPQSTAASPLVAAMTFAGVNNGDSIRLENNMIALGQNQSRNTGIYGLYNTGQAGAIEAYYNSIAIGGTVVSGSQTSAAFFRSGALNNTSIVFKNNQMHNTRIGGNGKHYVFINNQTSPSIGWGDDASDYNNLYASNSSTIASWGGADQSITDLKLMAGEQRSVSLPVVFTNESEADLSLVAGTANCGLDNLGSPVAGIASDYLGNIRSNATPDIGASEFSFVPAAPVIGGNIVVCATTPVQTITASAQFGNNETLMWYDAAIGGTLVTNPVLNSIGSRIYYAEAVNNTSGCKSLLRTPVSLTINETPTISLVSVPASNVFTGGVATNLYLGYGPQSTVLQSTVPVSGAPYTYNWTGAGLSNNKVANPVFTPTSGGTYQFTATATNKFGCSVSSTITICVLDIRVFDKFGRNTGKVYITHGTPAHVNMSKTIEMLPADVPDHVGSHTGDKLGKVHDVMCAANNTQSLTNIQKANEETGPYAFDVQVINNPSSNIFILKIVSGNNQQSSMRIFDIQGKLIEKRDNLLPGMPVSIGRQFVQGIYLVEVSQGNESKVLKLIKQ